MAKIVTMGEIMLRLSPPPYDRFIKATSFDVVYGGGEANVAVSLSNYGHNVSFVTKLPDNEIGQAAINSLRAFGVDTTNIVRGGKRIGVYFLEHGASMRPSKIIYDRAQSSIAQADISDFDFDKIFEGVDWFHITGITPALGDATQALTEQAMYLAKKKNITVSMDLNYRGKLWTPLQAQHCMKRLAKYIDVCIGNEEDAQNCLGLIPEKTSVYEGKLDVDGYKVMFKQMKEKFGFKTIATSLRESYSAFDNGWSALLLDGDNFYSSQKYDIHIVDRVGGGDAFAAGLIHGLLTREPQQALEFAVGASALKHTIFGDTNMVTEAEVDQLLKSGSSGRVIR